MTAASMLHFSLFGGATFLARTFDSKFAICFEGGDGTVHRDNDDETNPSATAVLCNVRLYTVETAEVPAVLLPVLRLAEISTPSFSWSVPKKIGVERKELAFITVPETVCTPHEHYDYTHGSNSCRSWVPGVQGICDGLT